MRKIEDIACLYIDFDAFFANVEKQCDKAIQDRPVGVTSLDSEQATLITRCYQAKQFGVKRGMRVYEARELCPDLIICPARHDVYVRCHNKILDVVGHHLPVTKVWSIDEVECQLMGQEKIRSEEIAEAIKNDLARHIGPKITASIGLSANQFLAKVAAEFNKPDGITTLHPKDLPGPLLSMPLGDFPGIAKGMLARLEAAGTMTTADLWALQPKHMRKIWGNVEGERMWAQIHGYAVSRPETTRRMFGHSRILSRDWKNTDKALDCLRLLTSKAAFRMRREGYTAGSMSVSLRVDDNRIGRSTEFAACDDDHTLIATMSHLFQTLTAPYGARCKVTQVSVMLCDIMPRGERSGDLFEDTQSDQTRSKWQKATQAMDALNHANGKRIIQLGPKVDVPGGYAGAKIAFGRVPDKEDFF